MVRRKEEPKHALLSASSAHRWLACPPSAMAATLYPEQDTDFTREGTQAHTVAYCIAAHAPIPPDCDATPEMVNCGEAYADYILDQAGPTAARLLEQRVDFSDWVPDGFGTADCLIIKGDTAIVIDYKYGQGVPVSAVGNPQMRLYALGVVQLLNGLYDIRNVETHIFQPRIGNVSVDNFPVEDLLRWAEETVKPAAELAAAGDGDYCAGLHCRFCPHAGKCRELSRVCLQTVTRRGARAKIQTMPGFEVKELLDLEPLISLWLKRVKDQALATLLEGGDIPGYKVVEGKQGNRKWTDELQVAAALDAVGISREDYTETKLLSPAAMDKALGKKRAAEILGALIDRAPGAPTVVPVADKRPVYDRLAEAKNDYKED